MGAPHPGESSKVENSEAMTVGVVSAMKTCLAPGAGGCPVSDGHRHCDTTYASRHRRLSRLSPVALLTVAP